MWPERTEVQKIPREEDLDPSRVYAFRKIVQELLIPAGVVDMAALACAAAARDSSTRCGRCTSTAEE